MDAHYTNGTIYQTNDRQTFPALPNIHSQFQQVQVSQPSSHTLPPLQPQRPTLGYTNEIFAQSSRPPLPLVPTQDLQYNDYVSQGQTRHTLPQASYPQSLQQFSGVASYGSQSSQIPVPKQYLLPDLRPTAISGINQTSVLPSNFTSTSNYASPPFSPNNPTQAQDLSPRTHVVGSQGRRGILPSAAGRPAAVPAEGNSSAKSAIVPTKDSDGKFPCPHCNKTYLHAKHLKRHLLRRK